jgi:RNA polymerase sigma-70 factor (ECF subfamily)
MDLYSSEEHKIIAGCKNDESWAKKKLYELYAPAMMGICFRYLKDYEKAKDALHEGFITIFLKIHTFSGGSFIAWMRRILIVTTIEHLRSDQSWRHTDVDEYVDRIETDEISAVEKLSAEEILKCISELPKGYQVVFNLYAIEGYSHTEIAQMLNIKEGSSRSQYAHARQLLQHKIQKLYIHTNTKKKYG